jgi:hypothetical protein
MRSLYCKLACALLTTAALSLSTTAQAALIDGGISMAGNLVFNTGQANTAISATFNNVSVTGVSGSFLGQGIAINSPGSVLFPNPLQWNPFVPTSPLWSTPTSTGAASFDALILTLRSQPGDNSLELRGEGVLHLTGFSDTPGAFILTANTLGGTSSFSVSTYAVPEPGALSLLLAGGLLALAARRRDSPGLFLLRCDPH